MEQRYGVKCGTKVGTLVWGKKCGEMWNNTMEQKLFPSKVGFSKKKENNYYADII